jgi:hypothetical protein
MRSLVPERSEIDKEVVRQGEGDEAMRVRRIIDNWVR